MNRRIFLDVGANTGQTLAAVLDSRFRFNWIVCFEPVQSCWDKLQFVAVERLVSLPDIRPWVRIEHFGLWNQTCEKLIFEPHSQGGSLWKKDKARSDETELCHFVRASEWFKENIEEGDIVFLKLNCEGAECDILDDLLDSGEFGKVSFAMIDFDAHKISSQKHREAELKSRLEIFTFPRVMTSKQAMKGPTHAARIQNWLRVVGA